ncbi:hypothetical protein ACSBR1_031825 [Camellia fascicularis]
MVTQRCGSGSGDGGNPHQNDVVLIGSIIRKSGIGLFSKPPVPALPPIAKSDAIKVKKDNAPIAKSAAIKVKKDDAPTIRWRKGELIGCGAFGRVYIGLNIDSGALLAIKQVSIAGNSASKEKTQAHIRELEEEVNLLENLSHPNIVRYLGTTREESLLNILLEIVPGGSISSLLGKFGSFPESVIRMYTKQLLLGVEYLHKNGIMHRDIKGANILVDNKGCTKLADFGASKKVVELATMTGAKSMKGTPYWMAPEVILQTGHSFSADIWSVGCTVIEMATGKPPWSQQYQEVAALLHIGTTKSHPPIPEHLSAEATDFLLKCLQKSPSGSAAYLFMHMLRLHFRAHLMEARGITYLKSALQNIFAENIVKKKEDFLQTFSTECDYIKSVVSKGEILQQNTTNAHNSDSNSYLKTDCSDLEVIRVVVGTMPVGHLYSRLVPLVLILVDVIYRFYHYLDSLRLRLGQILVLPPYQRKGYSRHLLEVLNNVAICENVYDLTIEEPLDSLQHKISQRQAKLKQIDNFMTVISDCVRAEVIGKDTGAAEKRVIEFPIDYDQEMSFALLEK